jgi:uncharacterized protein (DUF2235 family)
MANPRAGSRRDEAPLARLLVADTAWESSDNSREVSMKRIVVLIDGTWGKKGTGLDTNVAKLDCGKKIVTQAFVKERAANGTVQNVHYHDGVGG